MKQILPSSVNSTLKPSNFDDHGKFTWGFPHESSEVHAGFAN